MTVRRGLEKDVSVLARTAVMFFWWQTRPDAAGFKIASLRPLLSQLRE